MSYENIFSHVGHITFTLFDIAVRFDEKYFVEYSAQRGDKNCP